MSDNKILAIDVGADSGRVTVGTIDNDITLEEISRFSNGPHTVMGHLYWDPLHIIEQIKKGLERIYGKNKKVPASIGVTAWGHDCALLDKNGELLGLPYCYRDSRTVPAMKEALEIMPAREIYELTGNQIFQLNTVFQLYATKSVAPEKLEAAYSLLLTADLYQYFLTEELVSEKTLASTSQMFNIKTGKWAKEIFDRLGVPFRIAPSIIKAGDTVGNVVWEKIGLSVKDECRVIAPPGHDTASAVTGIPFEPDENKLFISSGTWSTLGALNPEPVLSEKALEYNFTNEFCTDDQYLIRKNMMGLWILQECRREWAATGKELSFPQLTECARKTPEFGPIFEPDDETFLQPGNMLVKINDFFRKSGQRVVQSEGEFTRAIYESLACKYKWMIDALEDILGVVFETFHVVGGGSKDSLLCQLTASATGKKVLAGPAEAATLGSIIVQARTRGLLSSLQEGHKLIGKSWDIKDYNSESPDKWKEQYEKFLSIRKQASVVI